MAGPIVVASVILPSNYKNPLIKDSKKLSKPQREVLCAEIKQVALSYAIEIIKSVDVDLLNPKQASKIGMMNSIKNLKIKPDISLIDAEKIEIKDYICLPFIKGDNLSQSIAAASILAKTTRDNIMIEYGKLYPEYNFALHKGYCVKDHVLKTQQFGVLPIHRKTYKPIKDILENNFNCYFFYFFLNYIMSDIWRNKKEVNMNLVNIIGQIEGDAEIAYTSKDDNSKLYKFVVRVPNVYKSKAGKNEDDLINVRAWSTAINDEFALHDQADVGIEARIHSSANKENTNIFNEIIANRIMYLN